jgi:hypothetical protein
MFREETKKNYRNLSMKNTEAREPPSMAEAETYSKLLRGKTQHKKEQNG